MRQNILNTMQTNSTLVRLIVAGLVWISTIVWVAKDSAQRTDSLWLHTIYIILVTLLTPVIGLPLYLLVRPSTYQKDRLPWRESMILKNTPCKSCGMMNLHHHQFCVFCGESIVHECKECHQSYPHHYEYCFHCGGPNIEKKTTTESA
jgi:RNA polymerase subunit RPABC4/transcription elongation factor Spt4